MSEAKTNTSKNKKVLNIVSNVITYLFLALCIFAVIMTIVSKRGDDGTAEIFGYQFRLVLTDSMAKNDLTDVSNYEIKSIPASSLAIVKVKPEDENEQINWYRNLKVGDVLTFKYVYTTQETITHRIISIEEKSTGGFVITLEGDNKSSKSGQLKQVIDTSIPNNMNYVIGKVVGQSRVVGFILSLTRQPAGLALLIIVPCVIIIIYELVKIFNVVRQEKKPKPGAKPELGNELEEILKQLEQLKKGD